MIKTPIPPKVNAWLRNSQSIRYLHLFERSCNLLNQNGELVSFVLPSIGLGPFSLIIPEVVMARLRQEPEILVQENGRFLTIGAERIEIVETAVWHPVPEWRKLRKRPFSIDPTLPPLPVLIEQRFQMLLMAVAENNKTEIVRTTKALAGLGEGLTPLGDDLLMGMLFGLWVKGADVRMIRLVGETAVSRTTTLSAAFLNAAMDGSATIHWHDLVNGLPNAAEKICSIGHLSGVGAWVGFVRTLSKVHQVT